MLTGIEAKARCNVESTPKPLLKSRKTQNSKIEIRRRQRKLEAIRESMSIPGFAARAFTSRDERISHGTWILFWATAMSLSWTKNCSSIEQVALGSISPTPSRTSKVRYKSLQECQRQDPQLRTSQPTKLKFVSTPFFYWLINYTFLENIGEH